MTRTYSPSPSKLTPATLPDETLTEIGRLVRCCAEIEDCITLHISNLAKISASLAVVLLGRTAVTRRLEIARYIANMREEAAQTAHKNTFMNVESLFECRNVVAHGVFLGINEQGRFSFLTSNTTEPVAGSAMQIVQSFAHADIANAARMAQEALPIIERQLKLQALRGRRLQQPLLPHRKGLNQRKSSTKQTPPPQS